MIQYSLPAPRAGGDLVDFQDIIFRLDRYWARHGCCLMPPCGGPAAQVSMAGAAGRQGLPPDWLDGRYRYSVALRPAPAEARRLFLNSFREVGIDRTEHDLRWLPLAGGLPGWQVLLDGQPLARFFYLVPAAGRGQAGADIEISLERLALASQRKKSAGDISWAGRLTYGDLHGGEVP